MQMLVCRSSTKKFVLPICLIMIMFLQAVSPIVGNNNNISSCNNNTNNTNNTSSNDDDDDDDDDDGNGDDDNENNDDHNNDDHNNYDHNNENTKPTLLDGLLKRRLAFHGHLVRKGGNTRDLMIERLHGTRPRGRPITTWLKDLTTQANISYKEAMTIPRDRKKWRSVGNPRRTPDE